MELTHLDKETTDGTVRNLDALYKLFPSCFTEAQDAVSGDMRRVVDWGKLRELLGEYVEDGEPEKYDFTWVGKRAAQREAAAPCRKTLRPCKEESVDWDTTQNLYIEGDNLEVLKLLQNSYMGKVKMIYIDPPYNTGNDFVYHDDFAQSPEEYDEHNLDDEGNRFRKNTDSNGRFHSDWCSMIYARLMAARSLLTEDGVILVSIDDNEVENLRKICNEVMGESNFIANLIWKSKSGGANDASGIATDHEYILTYAKNISMVKIYNSNTYELITRLIGQNGPIINIDFSMDSQYISTSSEFGELRIFSITKAVEITKYDKFKEEEWDSWTRIFGWPLLGYYDSKVGKITSCERYEKKVGNERIIAIGEESGSIKIYKYPVIAPNQTPVIGEITHGENVNHLKFAIKNKNEDIVLMSSSSDGVLYKWIIVKNK